MDQKKEKKKTPNSEKSISNSSKKKMKAEDVDKNDGGNVSTICDPERSNETKESKKGGNALMNLVPITLVISVIALAVSLIFAFTSKREKPSDGKLERQQFQLTERINSALDRIESAYARLEKVEGRMAVFEINGKEEKDKRGIIELKKAFLNFQEARSLINDDDMVKKIIKIEEEMKSTLALPGIQEAKVETGDEADQASKSYIHAFEEPSSQTLEPQAVADTLESVKNEEEKKFKTGRIDIIESSFKSSEPETVNKEEIADTTTEKEEKTESASLPEVSKVGFEIDKKVETVFENVEEGSINEEEQNLQENIEEVEAEEKKVEPVFEGVEAEGSIKDKQL